MRRGFYRERSLQKYTPVHYPPRMCPPENSSDLTAAQCEQLQAKVAPMLKWLSMVLNRLN